MSKQKQIDLVIYKTTNLLNGKIYTIAVTDVRGGQLISPVIAHN